MKKIIFSKSQVAELYELRCAGVSFENLEAIYGSTRDNLKKTLLLVQVLGFDAWDDRHASRLALSNIEELSLHNCGFQTMPRISREQMAVVFELRSEGHSWIYITKKVLGEDSSAHRHIERCYNAACVHGYDIWNVSVGLAA